MERIIQMAKETHTALELNTYWADLSPENISRRMEVGGMIAVVTDAHTTKHLFYMELGVGLARRGWDVPELVLNTRDVKGVREFVRRKRELMLGRLALK